MIDFDRTGCNDFPVSGGRYGAIGMTRVAVTTGDPGLDATEMRSVGGAWQADGVAELTFGVEGIGIDVRTPFVEAVSPEDAIKRCVPATVAALQLIAKGLADGSINPWRPDSVVFHFTDQATLRDAAAIPPGNDGGSGARENAGHKPLQLGEEEATS